MITGWFAFTVYTGNFWVRLFSYSIYVPIFIAFVWSLATIKRQLSKLEQQQTKSKSLLQNKKLLYFYIVTYLIQMV